MSARELVERFGSPLHVIDADVVRARWRALRDALPDDVAIFYAMKANPALGVVALLRSLGAGVEIASRGELLAAQAAGVRPDRILYAGPGKTDAEHEAAASAGILAIHAESEGEIRRLDALGRRLGRAVRIGVRVNVPWSAGESHAIIGGTGASKFGIPVEEALERAAEWRRLEGVLIEGLHVFNASNVLDADALVAAASRTIELGARLASLGLPIRRVDVGGGLGVPMSPGESPLDVVALGRGLARALSGSFRPQLVIEPGRHLVAEAGRFLMTVVDRKAHGGVEFLVVDGGIHQLLRPALVGQPHPIVATRASSESSRSFRVVGPLCTSLDTFGDHALPSSTDRGDVLEMRCTGAYGFTESMPAFLSHAIPAEVMLLGGEPHVLRPRRDCERHLEDQSVPNSLK